MEVIKECHNVLIKGSSHLKKKSVKFHTFGPDPPLKSVKLEKLFFFTHQPKHVLVKSLFKRRFFSRDSDLTTSVVRPSVSPSVIKTP